jgi:ribosomal-protein-alanine N-acetyltransferase
VRAAADEAEILTLAVDPAHRRTGIASRLLRAATAALSAGETQRVFLEVAADNSAALALYERHGFEVCGRRANYYGGGDKRVDAVMMRRALP